MRWRGIAGVLVAVLVLGAFGPTGVYAQTAEEMRSSIDVMRKQLDAQQKRLEQIESEQALQQKKTEMTVNQTVNQAITRQVLEYQPAMALLGPAAMPPSAFGLGLFLGFDAQFTDFRGVDFPFAVKNFNGASPSQSRPVGEWETVGVDREFSPRLTAGFYLPGGGGIVSANFLWTNADGTGSFANVNDSNQCAVLGLIPGDTIAEFGAACSAKAKTQVDFQQFDIQYQYPIQVTKTFRLTPEVGVRAVWFENTAKVTYFGCESCPDRSEAYLSIKQKSDSHGVGPKLGMSAVWEPTQGLSLGAAGSGGFLIGNTEYSHTFCRLSTVFPNPSCDRAHNFGSDESIGFPFVSGDFSLTYTFGANTPVKGLSVFAGYRVVSYFDMVTRAKIVGGGFQVHQNDFERKNLMADSFYFGLSYLF
jgi:hypothetical protein